MRVSTSSLGSASASSSRPSTSRQKASPKRVAREGEADVEGGRDRLFHTLDRRQRSKPRAASVSWLIAGAPASEPWPTAWATMRSMAACVVAQRLERQRDGAVDDLEVAAAGQLLELHQGEVGLDAGGVAIHHQADRAGGGDDRDLGVAEAVLLAQRQSLVPGPFCRLDEGGVGAVGGVERAADGSTGLRSRRSRCGRRGDGCG